MKSWTRALGVAPAAVWLATACSSASDSGSGFAGATEDAGASYGGDDASVAEDGSLAADSGGPPETKLEAEYQSPVSTGQYVWIANPSSGRVAYIQASTLAVATVAAGDGPTYLAAVPGSSDEAIVLNVLSNDATLLQASGGKLTATRFPLATDVNAWTVSGDGHWALAWGDVTKVQSPESDTGLPGRQRPRSDGQDPGDHRLHRIPPGDGGLLHGQRARVCRDAGWCVGARSDGGDASRHRELLRDHPRHSGSPLEAGAPLDGGASDAASDAAVEASPPTPPVTSAPNDVSITPNGRFALVRRDYQSTIGVVDLTSGALSVVQLPANATDLTLTPTGDAALVVMRDIATVATLPIPAITADPRASPR